MHHKDLQESQLDKAATRFLDALGQRMSRRGIIAQMTKIALGALGISLLPNLPLDRAFVAEATSCTDWRLCGICGYPCKSASNCCGGGTGSLFACPSCTTKGTAWSKCCCNSMTRTSFYVQYYDCCGGSESATAGCRDDHCARDCPQDIWCGGAGTYRCTIITVGGEC
jgi:hypothetical protein